MPRARTHAGEPATPDLLRCTEQAAFGLTDLPSRWVNVVVVVSEAPEQANLDDLFAAFIAEGGDGQGALDPRRLRHEGYGSHEASRLFSTWLACRRGFRRLLFEELNTTLEAARTRMVALDSDR